MKGGRYSVAGGEASLTLGKEIWVAPPPPPPPLIALAVVIICVAVVVVGVMPHMLLLCCRCRQTVHLVSEGSGF